MRVFLSQSLPKFLQFYVLDMLVLMPRSVPCPSLSAIVKCARIAARSRPKMKNGLSQRHMATKPLQHRPTAREVLLYADRSLTVINKPNGLISQLSDPHNQRYVSLFQQTYIF